MGIVLGLYAGWLVWPVSFTDTDVYDLRPDYQDEFVVMVAALHALEGDITVARQSLGPLINPSTPRTVESIVVDVTERYIARGTNSNDIRYLVGLAQALGSVTTPMQPYLNQP
jgi:hypothetical protein